MDWPKLPESPHLEILAPDDVRVGHSQIHLSFVLEELKAGRTPEDLVRNYPPLELSTVLAILAYHTEHRELVDRYVACAKERAQERYHAYLAEPPIPIVQRLRELKRAKKSA